MAKKNSKSDEPKAQPAENTAAAPLGSASKPALAPTPEVENEPEKGGSEEAPVEGMATDDEAEKSGEESFETTAPVSFTVEGKKYEGTVFSFPKEVVEDRKRIVRDAYPEVGIK